jgi:hypothetical protein
MSGCAGTDPTSQKYGLSQMNLILLFRKENQISRRDSPWCASHESHCLRSLTQRVFIAGLLAYYLRYLVQVRLPRNPR